MKYNLFKKKDKTLYIILLFFFSILINQYYGKLGINPIDSFFSFNSGYDVLNGWYPFKDYWTITGPFIAFTQALFFKTFGVSWFSYVLQASLFNFIITISAFLTFYKFKLDLKYCFFYSLLLAILSNPSAGTPYVDHQSAYLSVISIFVFMLALNERSKFYWFLLPIIIFISFLTKQAPTGYIFVIIVFLSFYYFILNFDIKKIFFGFLGSVFIVSIFLAIFLFLEIPIKSFIDQYILFPLSLGESRLEFLFPLEFKRIFLRYKLIHLSSILLFLVIVKNIFVKFNYIKSSEFIIILSLLGTSYALIAHQLMTINGIFIFFIIPVLCGFSHIFYLKYFKRKKYILYTLLFLSFFSTLYYGYEYIHKRDFMDLRNVNIKKSIDAKVLNHKLSGLMWVTTLYPDNPEKEIELLKEAIHIIKNDKRKISIVTDYQFISVILDSYDYSPSQVWFGYHVNPSEESKYFEIYRKFFLEKIKENNIELIYTVKPLWGGNNVFEKTLGEDCFKKSSITEILDSYLILDCKNLKF